MGPKPKQPRGRLLVIGGAEDPDESNMKILPHLVDVAGGKKARILVCSSPSASPDETVRTYRELFDRIGVGEVIEAPIESREEAEDPSLLEGVDRATAVFFTGGDQLRLTSLVAGTSFGRRVEERLFGDRLVVAGTSAGAAAMSGTMVIGGASEGTVRRQDVSLAPGLGYWRDCVVDTHFSQRGRVSRLLTVFGHNPQVMGVGLDENTAVDVLVGEEFTVIGDGAVTVFDGRVSYTSASQAAADEVIAMTDSLLHVLPDGYGFNLRTKRPRLPGGEEIKALS